MSDARPQVIADRYRLMEPLGQGGMGRVWKARDEVLHRDVAIKELVPPPGLTQDERREMRERSLREARAIARLNHINVVRVFDVLRTDGDPWIVMEYVESRSLQDTLAADGPVSPARAAAIGLGVLGALKAAHRAGVMHRDVKPGNVLLGSDGRVVLTDFGLATVPGDPNVTRTGLVLGSPAYIAPERARDGTAGPEADLWSLGATLYAAVEGQSPYARPSAIATLAALATEPPPPAKRAGPLKAVLNGLLRKDPANRINAEVAERLLRRAAGRSSRTGISLFEGARRPSPLGPRPDRTRIVPLPTQRPPQEQSPPARAASTPPAPPPVTPIPPAAETAKLSVPPAAETTKLPAPAAAETAKLAGPSAVERAEPADASAATGGSAPDEGVDQPAEPERRAEADREDAHVADAPSGDGAPRPSTSVGDAAEGSDLASDRPGREEIPAAADATALVTPAPAGSPSPASEPSQPAGSTGLSRSGTAGSGAPGSSRDGDVAPAGGTSTGLAGATRAVAAAVPAAVPALVGRAKVAAGRLRPGGDGPGDGPVFSRTGWLVLALVALVLLGTLVAVPLLVTRGGGAEEGPKTGQPAGTPTVPAATPTAPVATTPPATPTAAVTTPPAASPTAGAGGLGPPVVPAGWRLHRDPTGFQVPVPNGWRMRRESYGPAADQVRVTFSDPRGGRWLLVDQTNSPKGDPVADWRQQEKARKSTYANYRRITIKAIDYWDKAADWEWTYTDGGARHTVNRGFVTARDKAYALRWDTSADDWARNLSVFQVFADGFRPARS